MPEPTGEISHKLMTVEASRFLGGLSRSGRDKILDLPSATEQELMIRSAWNDAGDYESLSGHDAARALRGLQEFYEYEDDTTKEYTFPLFDNSEYHWLLESKFRRGVGLVVQKLTGYDDFELPHIDKEMPAEELSGYGYMREVGRLTVVNSLLFTRDNQISMSEYSFRKEPI